MKTVTLDVRTPADSMAEFAHAWKTGKAQKTARISFATPELLWKVLTEKRWELLKVPQDNAVAESFFSTLKNELVHHRDFVSRGEARSAIFEFIEVFYNRQRIHQALGYRTPEQVEIDWQRSA